MRNRWLTGKKQASLMRNRRLSRYSRCHDVLFLSNASCLPSVRMFFQEQRFRCSICLGKRKDSLFIPCGHYVACKECATTIVPNNTAGDVRPTCPTCKEPVTNIHKVVDSWVAVVHEYVMNVIVTPCHTKISTSVHVTRKLVHHVIVLPCYT